MLRRRDWSQAMVFRVGKNTSNPYVQALAYAETPIIGHVCCHGAAFLLVVLLPRRPSALVPRLWGSQSKFPVDRVKRLLPRSMVITIVWSRRIRTSATTPKEFHGSPQKSGSIANQLSELGFQVKIAIGETALSVSRKRCRTVGHLPPDVDANAGPEGMTEPRRLWRSLR